jgi:ankyrin repeat protein
MSLNLEQQRKRAKDLRRAHRNGSIEAGARIARHLPRVQNQPVEQVLRSGFTLSEAQHVIAREAGFASWPRLKHHFEEETREKVDLTERVIDAALSGDADPVHMLVTEDPTTTQRSIHAACVIADADAAFKLLESEPTLADVRGGRRNWTPLIYLCCSRYGHGDANAIAARRRIARRLLDLGADVNAIGREPGYTSANVTVFDEHEWTPVEAAAIRLADREFVKILLESGADLEKTSAVLTRAVSGGNTEVLRLLVERLPESIRWQLGWAAKASVALNRRDMAEILAAHNSPRILEQALLDTIQLERDAEFIEILIGDDNSPENKSVLKNAYRTAIRFGHSAAADVLRRHGMDDGVLTDMDRVIAACVSGKPQELSLRGEFREDEHRMLAWAIRAGLDPNVPDKDGETPLHLAVRGNSVQTIEVLVRSGAALDIRNFDAQTPLDIAIGHSDHNAREQLTRRLLELGARPTANDIKLDQEEINILFERAADAIAFGDLETLRELLDDEPLLVHARSPRPHRATLLNYCGTNGVEDERQRTPANAPAIMQLLLDRGADVNATCNLYGGGATTLGLHLTSIHPVRAGLRTRLAEILLNAGAMLDGARGIEGIAGAAAVGRLDLVRSFFDSDGSLKSNTSNGQLQSAFMYACEFGRTNVVEFLLKKGVDVTAQNGNEQTGLHLAALGGHLEIVRLLLHRKAPLELRNIWGGTVLGNALWGVVNWEPGIDYVPIIEMLVEAGAVVQPEYLTWCVQHPTLSTTTKERIAAILRR